MEEVPLSPVGREQIHKLESFLLISSIMRPDVLEALKNYEERLTWVDSLAVAAAALAREKAKMPISQIAEELGRTEATIRSHLQGKTKAGQIIKETYERLAREGMNVMAIPDIVSLEEVKRLRSELEKEKELRKELRSSLEEIKNSVAQISEKLSSLLEKFSIP